MYSISLANPTNRAKFPILPRRLRPNTQFDMHYREPIVEDLECPPAEASRAISAFSFSTRHRSIRESFPAFTCNDQLHTFKQGT